MKIRLGPSGIPLSCKYRNSIEGVKRIAQVGLDAMEVSFTHGVRMSNEMAKKLGGVAKKLDVQISSHVPYYINLESPSNLAYCYFLLLLINSKISQFT